MPNTTPTPLPEGTRLRIRMYRQGIGDCFLLTFRGGDQPRHILIDCGVLSGSLGGKAMIQKIAENIVVATGGGKGKLDALVVTHEHWDHVSGFHDAKEIFDKMDIKEIWLAWTEDPDNPLARQMKARNRLKPQAVHMALTQLAKAKDPQAQFYGQGIAGLMGFFGGPAEGATLAAFSEKTKEAMEAGEKGRRLFETAKLDTNRRDYGMCLIVGGLCAASQTYQDYMNLQVSATKEQVHKLTGSLEQAMRTIDSANTYLDRQEPIAVYANLWQLALVDSAVRIWTSGLPREVSQPEVCRWLSRAEPVFAKFPETGNPWQSITLTYKNKFEKKKQAECQGRYARFYPESKGFGLTGYQSW